MKVEVLYFAGCPNHEPTVERVRAVIHEGGIDAEVVEVEVRDDEEARRLGFIGSPSVRVDDVDIEPGTDNHTDYGVACRMYGDSGVPPRELIVAALESR